MPDDTVPLTVTLPAVTLPAVTFPATTQAAIITAAPTQDNAGELRLQGFVALSDRAVIMRVMQDIADSRSTLTLQLQTGQQVLQAQTGIFDVDAIPGAMRLYQLELPAAQKLLTSPLPVDISCALASGLLRFRGMLMPDEPGIISSYCIVSIPAVLHRQQQRGSFRVALHPGANRIALPLAATMLDGNCMNLSLGGTCCIFTATQTGQFKTHDTIAALRFELGNVLQFTTGAIICRTEPLETGDLRLGLRFQTLPAAIQRKLQTGLNALQRQLRRQHGGCRK